MTWPRLGRAVAPQRRELRWWQVCHGPQVRRRYEEAGGAPKRDGRRGDGGPKRSTADRSRVASARAARADASATRAVSGPPPGWRRATGRTTLAGRMPAPRWRRRDAASGEGQDARTGGRTPISGRDGRATLVAAGGRPRRAFCRGGAPGAT